MKKILLVVLLVLTCFILSSCNWNVLTEQIVELEGEDFNSSSFEVFTGEAPRNVKVSKAASTTEIAISFSSVKGADYYNIYRSVISRSEDLAEVDLPSLIWTRIGYVEEEGKRQSVYIDTINENYVSPSGENKDRVKFLYKVQAGSSYTDTYYFTEGKMSEIVEGYTLAAPLSITATKGQYDDRIELTWTQVEGVRGYDVYYTDDITKDNIEDWTLLSSNIPYNKENPEIGLTFRPSAEQAGKELYFAIRSVGNNILSDRSSYASGYTFVPGAPKEPENVTVSKYESPNNIKICWDAFTDLESNPELGYQWTIKRRTKDGDEIEIINFKSAERDGKDGLEYENGRYTYIDTLNLEPNEVYTYSIYASCYIEGSVDENGSPILFPGKAKEEVGAIISPPTDITIKPDYEVNELQLEIASPVGFENQNWVYVIEGRFNNALSEEIGKWKMLSDSVAVTDLSSYVSSFDADKANEFRIAVKNEESEISAYSEPVTITDKLQAPDVSVTANYYDSSLIAGEDGVYPVFLVLPDNDNFIGYEVSITENGEDVASFRDTSDNLTGRINLTEKGYAPKAYFEVYNYKIRGVDKFYSFSEWSIGQNGYGALTFEKYIKIFEMFALKPWEFINSPEYADYPDLKQKWSNSEIKKKIDLGNGSSLSDQMGALTDGYIYESTEYNNGRIGYNAKMQGIGGNITFVYENAGEVDGIVANGSYNMVVNASGTGDASGTIEVTGLYPATIVVPKKVTNKIFSGDYSVTMKYSNGEVQRNVTATKNNF